MSGRLIKNIQRGCFFVGWTLLLTGLVAAEPVDPRFPADRPKEVHERLSPWPWVRIDQLETERDQILAEISVLPQHGPIFPSDHLGYHSSVGDPKSDGLLKPHHIDIKLTGAPVLDSIALAPAFNPTKPGAYAFPKRFKIEVLSKETSEFETVVNWLDEDFPDPGPYPVFFSGINRAIKQLRITVPQAVQESGTTYYALGEIYLFRQRDDGHMGANIMAWRRQFVEVSDSFVMLPLWDVRYLYDGIAGLGFPLGDETVEAEDLMVVYDAENPPPEKVQIILDTGQPILVGRVEFWPAAAPDQLALPSFGFPKEVMVEISLDPDFEKARILETANSDARIYRGHLLSIIGKASFARYIRITMSGFSEYKGKTILGLGEISVSNNEEIWSQHCHISAQGIPDQYLNQLPRLVDGFSRQRRIMSEGEWIKGLAQRRPLDRRLVIVEQELELTQTTWHTIQLRLGIWGGSLLFAGLVGGLLLQQKSRKRGLYELKWRIARDLHDDVGSSLGSISLAAEQLKYVDDNAKVKEELRRDLSLMAREAWASLREVVWVIDESTIRLPALIQKLVERAERVLNEVDVSVEISKDCPDCIVSLTFKRHMIMFFKEILHNCARHARATQVWLTFSIIAPYLEISFQDNGCGFNPEEASEGLGLASIKQRAKEMGGELEIVSHRGIGTTVTLQIPLKSFLNNTDHLYKTSN